MKKIIYAALTVTVPATGNVSTGNQLEDYQVSCGSPNEWYQIKPNSNLSFENCQGKVKNIRFFWDILPQRVGRITKITPRK